MSCKICHRTFSSFSTHKNHLVSKRHINAENKELQTLRKTLQEQSQAYIEKSKSLFVLAILNVIHLKCTTGEIHKVYLSHTTYIKQNLNSLCPENFI